MAERARYEGTIVSPADGTMVGFEEPIRLDARAWRVPKEGPKEPADGEIRWRHWRGGDYKSSGPTTTLTFANRKNSTVALYVKSNDVARIKLRVICDALEKSGPVSEDEYVLALMIVTEGGICSDDEKRAIGATAINRFRHAPTYFGGATLRRVVEQKTGGRAQFRGTESKLYTQNVDDRDHVRDKMVRGHCEQLKRALAISRELLAINGLITPSGCSGPPFFFNQSSSAVGPDGTRSPRVHAKGAGGWAHSFYGWTGPASPAE